MLRIIAGNLGGRKIMRPDLKTTRPTTDKVREAIFSSITFDLPGTICLDLFSGSGAMAIEAVSRGALKVVANEKDRKAYAIVKQNIESLNINNIDVLNTDALTALKMKNNTEYDFVFLDPPYDHMELLNNCLTTIYKNKMLKKHGVIIVETNDPDGVVIPKDLMVRKLKKYGKTTVLYVVRI